jgi:hypothetical protein
VGDHDEALNLSGGADPDRCQRRERVITLAEDFPKDNQSIEMERGLTVRALDASGRTVRAFSPAITLYHLPIATAPSATIPIIQTLQREPPVRALSTPVLEDGASVGMVQTGHTRHRGGDVGAPADCTSSALRPDGQALL